MTTFMSLGIKKIERRFSGTKINNLDVEVVGKPIKILDYEICPSKKRPNTTYIKLQIVVDGRKRFINTGGKYLQQVLSQVNISDLHREPIDTKILKTNGYYYFEGTMIEDDTYNEELDNYEDEDEH